jgi:hypothetical protein
MRCLKQIGVGLAGVVLFGLMSAGVSYGQAHGAGQQSKMNMSKMDMSGTVFCPGMSTGKLCPMGTVNTLKLTGAKKQKWTEAANRYNKAVDAATKQLLEDSKTTLSPKEYAQVEKWFAKGLNPEINRLLAAKDGSAK